jgi:protein gp37
MNKTKIEWAKSTWNPITGCTKISSGCKNCYAERMAFRLKAMGQANYVNGFDVTTHENMLERPLHWRKPLMIFVNSMSDIFHEAIPFGFIEKVFNVMNRAYWHQFQVLTKRADNISKYNGSLNWSDNIWMGVTVEENKFKFRIDHLRNSNAKVKFLSLEPLIGPITDLDLTGIDWVIVGGESGPDARPMNEDWVRKIRDFAIKHEIPFFYKQRLEGKKKVSMPELDGVVWDQYPKGLEE